MIMITIWFFAYEYELYINYLLLKAKREFVYIMLLLRGTSFNVRTYTYVQVEAVPRASPRRNPMCYAVIFLLYPC